MWLLIRSHIVRESSSQWLCFVMGLARVGDGRSSACIHLSFRQLAYKTFKCRSVSRKSRRLDESSPLNQKQQRLPSDQLGAKPTKTATTAKTSAMAVPTKRSRSPSVLAERFKSLLKSFEPVRFRYGSTPSSPKSVPYTQEHLTALAWRLPLWAALVFVFSWEETAPFGLVSILGPSMLPTMAADGSDLWLIKNYSWRHFLGLSSLPPIKKGDIVGFSHPHHPYHRSCKRVIGLAGDSVKRYGEYVHLYVEQDPKDLGIIQPASSDHLDWVDPSCPWDDCSSHLDGSEHDGRGSKNPARTLVVPEGHVWLEGDCPGFAIDSRQIGPIPLSWIRGKVIARLWPLWKNHHENYRRRPHPIPLDDETLLFYNLNRIKKQETREEQQQQQQQLQLE